MKFMVALLVSFVIVFGVTVNAEVKKDESKSVKTDKQTETKKVDSTREHKGKTVADPNKVEKKEKGKDKKEKGKSDSAKQPGPNASEKAKEKASDKSAVADPSKTEKGKEKK